MIGALFAKEFRSLRPFLFLGLAILLTEIIDKLLAPIETQALGRALAELPVELVMCQLLLAFAIGSGLLVREIDDGTLNFLDGLPVTRSAVFAAKFMAAMLVLTTYPLGLILLQVVLHMGARESLDAALHLGLMLTFFALSMLVTAVGLTLGMLLGFLRSLSWLVLCLCAVGIMLLKDKAPSLHAALNPADLLTLRFVGVHWQLPHATIWTQLGAALLFAVLAFGLFKSAGGVLARVRKWQRARRLLLAPAVVGMLVAAVAGIGVIAQREAADPEVANKVAAAGVQFTPAATGHATTTHYTFSYPASSGERLRPFIKAADQTFAAAAPAMETEGGAPIDVDLSGTTDNHAGTAYLDRIRMKAGGTDALATLAHESAHVFAMRLAGGESAQQLERMVVFNEGLAQWVEDKVSGGDTGDSGEDQELAAAVVSQRRMVSPRQLTDFDAFGAAVDENLKYPLGAAFMRQLAQRYGNAAPKTVLQTLARADFPRDLQGYELWQTAFQISGFDLDLVFDDYARYLKGLERKYAREIAVLPRLRGSLVKTGTSLSVALRHDLPMPDEAYPLVRLRPGMASTSEQYRTSYAVAAAGGKLLAIVPQALVTRGEVCFQAGLWYRGVTLYEPWSCLAASSASVAPTAITK